MALKLNGRDDELRRADFKTVATRASLKAATADEIIDRTDRHHEECSR
jgi:serine/threonine-protein kinase HipA